jgi:hypothetical protein
MRNEPKEEMEIDKIREEIYEETKDMNPAERASYANGQAQNLINEYGLNVEYENKILEIA